jgi:ubiquitin conjugation factor E4 A
MLQVGPKQRDYKVKDRKEYEFKPEQIVSDIAHIYVYLGRDENFCKAVLGESRSFSHNLLPQAVSVLSKIGVSQDFIAKFEDLSVKLKVSFS